MKSPDDVHPAGDTPHMDDEALLTAYALGELEGAERDAVAARVAADPEAQALVAGIRGLGDRLTEQLASESAGRLTAEQRAAIAAAAAPAAPAGRMRNLWPLVGMAASVVAGVGLATWLTGDRRPYERLSAEDREELAQLDALGYMGAVTVEKGGSLRLRGRRPLSRQAGRDFSELFSDAPGETRGAAGSLSSWSGSGGAGGAGSSHEPVPADGWEAYSAETRSTPPVGDEGGETVDPGALSVDRLNEFVGSGGGGSTAGKTPILEPHSRRRDPLVNPRWEGERPADATLPPVALSPSPPPTPGAATTAGAAPVLGFSTGGALHGGARGALGGGAGAAPHGPYVMSGGGGGGGARLGGGREGSGPDSPGGTAGVPAPGGGDGGVHIVDQFGTDVTFDGRKFGPTGEGGNLDPTRVPVVGISVLADLPRLGKALQGTQWNEVTVGGIVRWARVRGSTVQPKVGELLNVLQAEEGVETAVAEVALEQLRRLRARDEARRPTPNGEWYEHPGEPTFRDPTQEPLSTFSIDVDTASYANIRRFLSNGQVPPAASIRIEEMINYFPYDQAAPTGEHPIGVATETAACPWNPRNRLVRVGLKAREIGEQPPASNLVFLVDVSGSMKSADKLPLLQRSLKLMAQQMREQDSVAVVVYASESGVRLPATHGADQEAIMAAFDGLTAGGSTNGGAGIQEAYRIAKENFVEGGVNRVILATDGDFNVGVTDRNQLVDLVRERAQDGVFLTVLGVGTGNLKDAQLESLADKGNGQYAYLDGLREARKVLVEQMHGTLVAVAKDVKVQLEFNPVQVGAYRLIGYENRVLAAADFNDDQKDAGEMGAGHSVTMLYEIVPAAASPSATIDSLKYQKPRLAPSDAADSGELLTVKVRYKQPDGHTSVKLERTVTDSRASYSAASADFKFASAVASFGMLLRGSPSCHTTLDGVLELGTEAIGADPKGYRTEFLDLVLKAKSLTGR